MEKLTLNIVTCGNCGKPFGHLLELTRSELTCPYCEMNDDISSFPDLYYQPDRNDSIFIIDPEAEVTTK